MPGTGPGPGDRAARGPGSTASQAWLVKTSEEEERCPCQEVNEGGWSRLGRVQGTQVDIKPQRRQAGSLASKDRRETLPPPGCGSALGLGLPPPRTPAVPWRELPSTPDRLWGSRPPVTDGRWRVRGRKLSPWDLSDTKPSLCPRDAGEGHQEAQSPRGLSPVPTAPTWSQVCQACQWWQWG